MEDEWQFETCNILGGQLALPSVKYLPGSVLKSAIFRLYFYAIRNSKKN